MTFKLVCPNCNSSRIQMEETTTYTGEFFMETPTDLIKPEKRSGYNQRFYCLNCEFHTKTILDFGLHDV